MWGVRKTKGPHHDESETFHGHAALVCKLVIAHSLPCFVKAFKDGMDRRPFLLHLRGSFVNRRNLITMRMKARACTLGLKLDSLALPSTTLLPSGGRNKGSKTWRSEVWAPIMDFSWLLEPLKAQGSIMLLVTWAFCASFQRVLQPWSPRHNRWDYGCLQWEVL